MKSSKSSKSSFLDLFIEYIFALIGFFLGTIITAYVLGLTGLRAFSEQLLFLLSEVGGALAAMFAFVRSELNRIDRRTAFHKELDAGGERDAFRFGTILRQLRMPYDLIFAVLLPVVFVRHDFTHPISTVVTVIVGILLILAIRLLAVLIARKKWAKEHIRK